MGKESKIEIERWTNEETGETITVPTVNGVIQRPDEEEKDSGFDKVWLAHIMTIIDDMGNQKMKVIGWLLKNRDRRNNHIIATQKLIADGANVSTTTVSRVMKSLFESNIISMQGQGVYRLNPDLIFYGKRGKRMNILYRYKEERAERTGEDPYKKEGKKPQLELAEG